MAGARIMTLSGTRVFIAISALVALVALVALACSGEEPPVTTTSAEHRGAVGSGKGQESGEGAPVAASCLLDRGGCAVAAGTIEPCGEITDPAPVTLEQVLRDPVSHNGETLAIRGPLAKSGAGCTERSCEATCCNACTAMVTLGDPRNPAHVRLESTTRPGRYRCIGDESMTCCEIDPKGQEVIAQGVFHVVAGLEPVIHQLWTSELCLP